MLHRRGVIALLIALSRLLGGIATEHRYTFAYRYVYVCDGWIEVRRKVTDHFYRICTMRIRARALVRARRHLDGSYREVLRSKMAI